MTLSLNKKQKGKDEVIIAFRDTAATASFVLTFVYVRLSCQTDHKVEEMTRVRRDSRVRVACAQKIQLLQAS